MRSPAMPNGRCRMHGEKFPGAPRGNKNALKHGRYTADAIVAGDLSPDVAVDLPNAVASLASGLPGG